MLLKVKRKDLNEEKVTACAHFKEKHLHSATYSEHLRHQLSYPRCRMYITLDLVRNVTVIHFKEDYQ